MNQQGLHVWTSLTPDASVRVLKYTFGPGTSNTLAVQLANGTWLVVSPASDVPPFVLDDLAKDGDVSALLAPNAYHHLGQAQWRARFPGATSYAPEGALPRLAKKSRGVPYRPLAELAPPVRPSVELFTPQGLKSPDVLLCISARDRTVWWLGDLFSNSTAADQVWWLRLVVAPLAGSGLGYRRNAKPGLVYVSDAAAWLASTRAAIAAHPPSIVVPAHGDPVIEDTAKRTQALLEAPLSSAKHGRSR